MAGKTMTAGSMALREKQCRVITIEATGKPQDIKLRVAAYARVSSASDDQLNSFAAQNRYYTALISGKENWTMVDIYADEGITGTSAEKREDFQRLLADCRRGLIDRVLVKSISRFARNTKECLEALRELKLLGVSVYFEKENIDTATMSGEMMTTLFASFAQAESESISGNMRWSNRNRMAAGTFLPSSMPYGYTLREKEIVIEPAEALVVCEIFQYYLGGMGKSAIAALLNERGLRTKQGHSWRYSSIDYILGNERYIGDSLWQKSYATESFPTRKAKNHGEVPQYYAEGTHPPILSRETYQAALTLAAQRGDHFGRDDMGDFPFSKKVYCTHCGKLLRRKKVREPVYWACLTHEKDRHACTLKQIPDAEIRQAFLRLYYKLKHHGEPMLSQMLISLQAIRNRRMLWSLDVIEMNKQISDLTSQNQMLAKLKQQGLIDPDIFIAQRNELTEQLRAAKLKKERLLVSDGDDIIVQTQELLDILDAGPDFLDAFDAELFGELVDKIFVDNNEQLRFRLKNGLELTEAIERTVR